MTDLRQQETCIDKVQALSQASTPYLDALLRYAESGTIRFHCPGHMGGSGAPQKLVQLLGDMTFKMETNEVPQLDSYQNPQGPLLDALKLAAEAYGADRAYFLLGGSTLGNLVMVSSVVSDGDLILVPRNAHKSIFNAIIISGATPVFLQPVYDYELQIDHCVLPEEYERQLNSTPKIRAMLAISPTYYGVTAALDKLVNLANRYDIPLLVDQAWGAHLRFSSELPPCALESGADMVVMSPHKLIGSFTGTSMLFVKGKRLDTDRIEKVLMAFSSTSPNSLMLASLDAVRMVMATQGDKLLQETLRKARYIREELRKIYGVTCIGRELLDKPGVYGYDETRIVFSLSKLGYTGYEIETILARDYNIQVEMAELFNVVLLVTIGTRWEHVNALINAIKDIVERHKLGLVKPRSLLRRITELPDWPPLILSPREAFIAPQQALPLDESVGHISAELITTYPPGIPIIVPGEKITEEVIEYLKLEIAAGGRITGMADKSLRTIKVVRQL